MEHAQAPAASSSHAGPLAAAPAASVDVPHAAEEVGSKIYGYDDLDAPDNPGAPAVAEAELVWGEPELHEAGGDDDDGGGGDDGDAGAPPDAPDEAAGPSDDDAPADGAADDDGA